MKTFSTLLGPLWGESIGHRWIPSQRPVARSFDVFFALRPNKRPSEQQVSEVVSAGAIFSVFVSGTGDKELK